MDCVLDVSAALAWLLPDETLPSPDALKLKAGETLVVPALWWYELANGLLAAERSGRLTEAEAAKSYSVISRLPIEVDSMVTKELSWRLLATARAHGLSAYDAAYLELAERRGAALATLDSELRAAAKKDGVPLAI